MIALECHFRHAAATAENILAIDYIASNSGNSSKKPVRCTWNRSGTPPLFMSRLPRPRTVKNDWADRILWQNHVSKLFEIRRRVYSMDSDCARLRHAVDSHADKILLGGGKPEVFSGAVPRVSDMVFLVDSHSLRPVKSNSQFPRRPVCVGSIPEVVGYTLFTFSRRRFHCSGTPYP